MTSFSDFLMQLNQDYQSDKIGTVYQCPERKITRKIKDPHTLILIVGVEGAGKTTFCKNNFSGFNVINFDSFIADNIKSVKDEEFDSLWNKFLNHAKECLQKGTMEAADSVYGVTMEENGISKLLSMKLQ